MKMKKSMMKDWRKYFAEYLGTKILALVGFGSLVLPMALLGTAGGADLTAILGVFGLLFAPFAFGFALSAVLYITGPISGGHVNPAVSLAFAIRKKLSWKDCIMYVICQFVGAIAGVAILFGLFKLFGGGAFRFAETFADKGPRFVNGLFGVLILEAVMTFIFVLAWMGIVRKVENKTAAGILIGLTFVALIITGATLNPALSLGTAVFSGVAALRDVWLFLVAPIIGGVVASFLACCLFKDEDRPEVGTKNAPKIADVTPVKEKTASK